MAFMPSAPITYHIHGIISVVSDAALPELEPFRVSEAIPEPSIRLRIGRSSGRGDSLFRESTRYHDGLASLGFAIEIGRGERVESRPPRSSASLRMSCTPTSWNPSCAGCSSSMAMRWSMAHASRVKVERC